MMTSDTPSVSQTAHSASIILGGPRSRAEAKQWIDLAPAGWVCTLEQEPRSLPQGAKFYALCTQLSKSDLFWNDERQTKRGWHDLLIHAWMLATDRHPKLVAGLNGGRVSLLLSTRDMKKDEMSELIEFSIAWATGKGIEVPGEP